MEDRTEYLVEIYFIPDMPCSSDSTSDQDGYGPSTSLDSNMDGRRLWQRSGSIFNLNIYIQNCEHDLNYLKEIMIKQLKLE